MLRQILMIGLVSLVCLPRLVRAVAPTEGDALAEITVTAEKQTENLQKTAAAVTALPVTIWSIRASRTSVRRKWSCHPSDSRRKATIPRCSFAASGANLDFPNVEPNVAFNFAGIYLPREATSAAFFDVAAARGPAGLAGHSLWPKRDRRNHQSHPGETRLQQRRRDHARGRQLLVRACHDHAEHQGQDIVALRAAVDYAYDDGYEVTGAYSKNDISVRLSTIINPFDRLSIYLWARAPRRRPYRRIWSTRARIPRPAPTARVLLLWQRLERYAHGRLCRPRIGRRRAEEPLQDRHGRRPDRLSIRRRDLSYIPSYLYLDARPLYWLSAIQSTNTAHYNQLTQELRLASDGVGHINGWRPRLLQFEQ